MYEVFHLRVLLPSVIFRCLLERWVAEDDVNVFKDMNIYINVNIYIDFCINVNDHP